MNTVKDFTIGQRVATDLGDGTVTKIGRVYVYVEIDGSDKVEKLTPADLRDLPVSEEIPVVEDEPVMIVIDEAHEHATADYLSLMSGAGKSQLSDVAGQLVNAAPTGGRPPMRIKGKRSDAGHRKSARKQQKRSRRANRTR